MNALELQVNFSGEILEKEEAGNELNYEITLNGKKLDSAIEDIKVTNKTALLRLATDALSTGDKITVQVSDAITGERYASEVIEYTSKAPVLTKEPQVKGEHIHLTFDRPVTHLDGLTLVKLDGIALLDQELTAVENTAGNYEYTVSLKTPGQDLTEDATTIGTHEVKIFDVADAAAKNPAVAPYLTGSYTLTEEGTPPEKVETAPVVEKVTELNANKFEIEFDQPLANNEFDLKVIKGNHTFFKEAEGTFDSNAIKSSTVYTEHAPAPGKPNRYVVIVTGDSDADDLNPLYKNGEESVDLTVEVTNHKSNTELLVGKKEVKSVTLSKTDGKPKADNGDVLEDEILLPLNGPAEFTADYDSNAKNHIVLRDAKGIVIESKFFEAKIEDQHVVIEATQEANNPLTKDGKIVGAPFTVEFKANTMMFEEDTSSVAAYNLINLRNDAHVVSAVSVNAPTVDPGEDNFKYYVLDAKEITIDSTVSYGQIVINYGKEMDKETALNINNYKLDGEALPAGSKAEFLNNTKTVAITVPEGTFKATTDYRFQIETDVLTEAGQNVVRDAQSKLPVVAIGKVEDNEAPSLVNAEFAVAVADKDADISKVKTTNLVKLTFSEAVQLTSADADKAVEILINDVKYTGTVADEYDAERQLDDKETNTDRVLMFELDQKVGVNQDATITVLSKNDSEDYAIEDLKNNKVKPGTLTIVAGKVVKVKKTQAEIDAEAEAGKLETATTSVTEAVELVKALKGDGTDAAEDIEAAEEALGEATTLVEGLTDGEAKIKLQEKLEAATTTVEEAKDALETAKADALLAEVDLSNLSFSEDTNENEAKNIETLQDSVDTLGLADSSIEAVASVKDGKYIVTLSHEKATEDRVVEIADVTTIVQ